MKIVTGLLILAFLAAPIAARADVKPVQFSLSLAYAGLAVADTALTIYGTSHLGLVEKNKLFAPLFEHRQYALIWAADAVSVALLVGVCHFFIHSDEKYMRLLGHALLVAAVIFKGAVVMHNIRLHSRVN